MPIRLFIFHSLQQFIYFPNFNCIIEIRYFTDLLSSIFVFKYISIAVFVLHIFTMIYFHMLTNFASKIVLYNYWHDRLRCSQLPYLRSTGNDHYLFILPPLCDFLVQWLFELKISLAKVEVPIAQEWTTFTSPKIIKFFN